MNLHIGNKRNSTDDINERRKRRRTISNDLNRGINLTEQEAEPANKSDSETDLSSSSSELNDAESNESTPHGATAHGASSSHCNRCSNCKCDEVPKLLKAQNEILSLLSEIRKKNTDIHKSVMLEMQICRQEIIDEVHQLKENFTRMMELARRTNYNQENMAFLEIADHDDQNGDDESENSELSSDDEIEERHYLFR